VVTAIAALEEGRTNASRAIECTGRFKATRFRCWTETHHLPPHGPVTLAGALERSCNCYFYQMGEELGLEGIVKWASRLGFGKKTGIELREEPGVLPLPERHAKWQVGDSYSLAIGQHELAVTLVQVARLMATVANGGTLVRPHVVRGNGCNEPLPISKATLEVVRQGLWAVVHGEHGTAHASDLARLDVAGKTSSAQTGKEMDSHAWFGGTTSRVALVVMVEHGGGGGQTAAPVAAKILEKLK
jgi:penicillin-binding protein 2